MPAVRHRARGRRRPIVVGVVLVALIGLNAPTAAARPMPLGPAQIVTDWPKYHFDVANTGYNHYETTIGPSNVSTLTLAWHYNAGVVPGTPAVARGSLYVSTIFKVGKDTTSAMDATTGALFWKTTRLQYGSPVHGTAYYGGMVYFGTDEGTLHALDAATGRKVWNAAVGPPSDAEISAGTVYVRDGAWGVRALDARTGTLLWKSPFLDIGFAAPTVVGGLVYVGSYNGYVYALDATTGSIVWSYATAGFIEGSSVVVSGGLAYVSSGDMNLYALDATTGALLWKAPLGPQEYNQPLTPALANGVVYAEGDGDLQAFDAGTGAPLWSTPLADGHVGSPVVANGVVYIPGWYQGHIYALDAASGAVIWSYKAGGQVADPVIVNGMLFFGSSDHNLYAFKLPTASR